MEGEVLAATGDSKGMTNEEAVPGPINGAGREVVDEWRCTPCGAMEDEEDVEPLKSAVTPVKPDEATVALQRKTHIPYRNWCRECIMGRGLCEQRGRHVGRPHDIPRVGIDYWFITSGSIKMRHELEFEQTTDGNAKLEEARGNGHVVKCLIIRCYETKCVFAHVVPQKGADEDRYAVGLVVSAVVWLGHVRVILKSDGEPAVVKLVQEALKEVKCSVDGLETITHERSGPYDSQANGGTEVGVRIVRGQFRTLRLCLEKRIGNKIPPNHPLTPWLLEHTALLLNACVRGADGLTSWQRARGRPFGMTLYSFGEAVYWKQPVKGPQHDTEGNMGPRQWPGIFLGYNKVSSTYRILTQDGDITKARALQSKPEEDKWEPERLKAITVTPWSLRRKAAAVRIDVGAEVPRHEEPQNAPPSNPRRLKITKQTLDNYGTTDNCRQCRHYREFKETKDGLAHSEKCRKRILEAMNQTDVGRARLERHEERIDQAIAERIREADTAERPSETRPISSEATEMEVSQEDRPEAAARPSHRTDAEMADEDGHYGYYTDQDDEMIGAVTFEDECALLLTTLGAPSKAYKRERRKTYNRIVTEVYSPPRVTRMASYLPDLRVLPGYAFL